MIQMMKKIGLLEKRNLLMKIIKKKNKYFTKFMIKATLTAIILDIRNKSEMMMETFQL